MPSTCISSRQCSPTWHHQGHSLSRMYQQLQTWGGRSHHEALHWTTASQTCCPSIRVSLRAFLCKMSEPEGLEIQEQLPPALSIQAWLLPPSLYTFCRKPPREAESPMHPVGLILKQHQGLLGCSSPIRLQGRQPMHSACLFRRHQKDRLSCSSPNPFSCNLPWEARPSTRPAGLILKQQSDRLGCISPTNFCLRHPLGARQAICLVGLILKPQRRPLGCSRLNDLCRKPPWAARQAMHPAGLILKPQQCPLACSSPKAFCRRPP